MLSPKLEINPLFADTAGHDYFATEHQLVLVTLHNQQVLGLIIKCGPDVKRNQGRSLVAVLAQTDRREAAESYLRLMHIEVSVVIHHYLDFVVVVFAVWISHFRVFCVFCYTNTVDRYTWRSHHCLS